MVSLQEFKQKLPEELNILDDLLPVINNHDILVDYSSDEDMNIIVSINIGGTDFKGIDSSPTTALFHALFQIQDYFYETSITEESIKFILKNRHSSPEERIDITSEEQRKKFLGL